MDITSKKTRFCRMALCMFAGALLVLCVAVSRDLRRISIEQSWKQYTKHLASAPETAYSYMSARYKRMHSPDDFLSEWSQYGAKYLVTSNCNMHIIYIGLSVPFSTSEDVFISASGLALPLWMEDGFLGIVVNMRREEGLWRVDDFPFHVIGR